MKVTFRAVETAYFLLLGAVSAFAALLQGWPPIILAVTVIVSGIPLVLQEYENEDHEN